MENNGQSTVQMQTEAREIRQKLAAAFGLLIILLMLLSIYIITWVEWDAGLERAKGEGQMLGKVIAVGMAEQLARNNFQGIEFALREYAGMGLLRYCVITSKTGKIIAGTDSGLNGKYLNDTWSFESLSATDLMMRHALYRGEQIYEAAVPIIIGEERFGSIRLGFPLQREFENIRKLLILNFCLGLAFLLIALFVAFSLSYAVTGRIEELAVEARGENRKEDANGQAG
ncbi:hypothetical protein KBA41_06030 [Candidatus Ozemobacteraceae bacterium]|nr:hypothetical protein [Candidatus Ozemobacteraceae bacterium]